jgi:hypothetical protein
MMRKLSCWWACVVALAALASGNQPAHASDEFPIVGTFVQGKACKGDGTDPKALLVIITPTEIQHRQGVCTISDKRVDGDKLTLNATCRTRAGHVMAGDVSFTRRDSQTFDMVDQDATIRAVLHRCPER